MLVGLNEGFVAGVVGISSDLGMDLSHFSLVFQKEGYYHRVCGRVLENFVLGESFDSNTNVEAWVCERFGLKLS